MYLRAGMEEPCPDLAGLSPEMHAWADSSTSSGESEIAEAPTWHPRSHVLHDKFGIGFF